MNKPNQLDRQPAVAGQFYPDSKALLEKELKSYFDSAKQTLAEQPLALIVPHAGYVFSGLVAASGYRQLDRNKKYKHIFLIGSSHTMFFNGAAVYTKGAFITPLGRIPIDPLAEKLVKENSILTDNPEPHLKEHSLEVQLPFLQYWLKKEFSIIPIVIGGESQTTPTLLAEALEPYFTPDNLFIISSDFSHYPSYDDAKKTDDDMAHAIATNSPVEFMKAKIRNENAGIDDLATAMCGWTSGLTLLKITENKPQISYKTIMYRNSGDSPYGGKDRVVGYWAIAAVQQVTQGNEFNLTDSDKHELLILARKTITNHLNGRPLYTPDEAKLSDALKTNAGAFVTLHNHGRLRGCIGNFSTSTPLYRVVMAMAISAATEDYRFESVTAEELKDIDIEISVLTPMKRINHVEEIELGRHGIYIKKGIHSGTFLPQVAKETNWSLQEFLGHCARDKAGIGWDGWRDAEIYTYEAIVFDEKQMGLR
ncbi:AmmeMemoRadiSam system protein B [Tenuifilum thalassicum]|uniref:MEMO1 family protein FHG85_10545 n=2 Tax=Tenuifilum thalassicum TaxID=2590900 RepID=A0A7D3Y1I8_9BACT|nr:AmmeMemoRadiSam system protein B [Tenuifilum thalassicum]